MPNTTVLHDRHVRLGGRIVDFHGWLLPVQYEGILAEHRQCRTAAALFDTSHMGQILVRGPSAAADLGRICTQNAPAMPVGRCRYGLLLNEQAGILDDTILARLADDEFLLVVNAGPREADLARLRSLVSAGSAVEFLSERNGKLDLQGPRSYDVLAPHLEGMDLAGMKYFHAARGRCVGRPCIVSRTGYTGELGYEIIASNDDLPVIFDALRGDASVKPTGLGARDLLRLEMGYPLHGDDIDATTHPVEAGLDGFIDREAGFIGAEALAAAKAAGPTRRLMAFRSDSRRKANAGDQLVAPGGDVVGAVTSAAYSPSLEVSIGMGYVATPHAGPGNRLAVRTARGELAVELADKPLYKLGTFLAKIGRQ